VIVSFGITYANLALLVPIAMSPLSIIVVVRLGLIDLWGKMFRQALCPGQITKIPIDYGSKMVIHLFIEVEYEKKAGLLNVFS
jgi:hypothetical protein